MMNIITPLVSAFLTPHIEFYKNSGFYCWTNCTLLVPPERFVVSKKQF